jgi:S1-C subfamily serine protease
VLTKLAGRAMRTMDDVHSALGTMRPGQKVEAELERDGKALKVVVQLGERPGAAAAE